jgi:hypothetical protein
MGEAHPQEFVGVGFQQSRDNRGTFSHPCLKMTASNGRVLTAGVTQVMARFLSKIFQRKACRPETAKLVCARFAPYFSVTHPTRGTIPGPFFKLPTGHRRLVLDVVATMLHDQDVRAAAGEFLSVVEKSLAGHEEENGYWDQISRGVCGPVPR